MIIASSRDCWLAGTIFIGGAFTGLIFLISGGSNINRYELLLITIGVAILLLALKGYLINEEWRQKRCYDRMQELEREGRIDSKIIGRIHSLTTHSPFRCFRFPWRIELTLPDETKETERLSNQKRRPFGWEFLHTSAWAAIIVWMFLCWVRWNHCPFIIAGLLLGVITASFLLGQFFPISGVRLLSGVRIFTRRRNKGNHRDSTKSQSPAD